MKREPLTHVVLFTSLAGVFAFGAACTSLTAPPAPEPIAAEMRKAAEALRRRTNDDYGRIEQNRYIVHNSPVLSGSRVPTSAVWNLHEAKYTTPRIIAEYPRLTRKDVAAAIAYERQQRRERTG